MARSRILIDVRTSEEWDTGYLEGAHHIPFQEIQEGINTIKGISKASSILLYCRSGRRSAIAKHALEDMGFLDVTDLKTLELAQAQLRLPIIVEDYPQVSIER